MTSLLEIVIRDIVNYYELVFNRYFSKFHKPQNNDYSKILE